MNDPYIYIVQRFIGKIMNKDWLKYKVESIEALEEESSNNLKRDDPNRPHIHIPFGFMNSHWLELRESMGEGDELWFFTSDPDTWGAAMQGREGYVVLRNGEPTNCILTKLS